jgi:RNase H
MAKVKAALMALSLYEIYSSIVMQSWTSLQGLSTLNRVGLSWVPGHCNIAGNEMADKLAREGSAAILLSLLCRCRDPLLS